MKTWVHDCAVAAWAVMAPSATSATLVVALVAVDLLTGLAAARKEKKKWTSAKLGRTVSKLFVYVAALVVARLFDWAAIVPQLPLLSLVATTVALTEGKSVFENFDRILGEPVFGRILSSLTKKQKEERKDD